MTLRPWNKFERIGLLIGFTLSYIFEYGLFTLLQRMVGLPAAKLAIAIVAVTFMAWTMIRQVRMWRKGTTDWWLTP